MDPKGFSDFIQKHGQIVGVEPVKGKTEFDEDSFIYKFEDGATVHYTPAVLDKSGKEIEPAKFIPDESKPVEAARKATTAGGAAQESIAAPAGQPWVARTGPINEEHPDGIYWTQNKNYTEGAKKASGQPYKNASGQWVQRWDDGTTTVLPPEATPFEKPDTPTPGEQDSAELLRQKQANQAAGKGYKTDAEVERDTQATTKETETKRNTWKPVGRETVKNEQTGVTEEVTMEENLLGERRPVTNKSTTIAKPEANPPIGRLPEGTHLGNITRGVMESAREIHDDPNLSPQDKIKAYDLLEKYGSLLANEEEAILRSQQNTLSNQTSQRNTDIQEAASRRTFSANLMDNAFKNTATKVADPSTVAPAFMAQIELGIHLAQKLGGLNTYDRVQPGLMSQQTDEMGFNGSSQGNVRSQQPLTQPAPQPSSPVNITFNQAPGQVPAAVESAMGGPPVPEGMRFEGGQLRAPGFTAQPEEEAQIPEWMRQQQYA